MNKDNEQREIKFRVWNPKFKEFNYWGFMDGHFKGPPTGSHLTIEDCSKSDRFTGLLDKNGKEIYQGDKITWSGASDFCVVIWSGRFAGFGLRMNGWLHTHFFNEAVDPNECEVIGHIYSSEQLESKSS
jgi:hypothetical protein